MALELRHVWTRTSSGIEALSLDMEALLDVLRTAKTEIGKKMED
jgi:hypothetical protein